MESKEACHIPALYLVQCVTAVRLAGLSSAGGAVVIASLVFISASLSAPVNGPVHMEGTARFRRMFEDGLKATQETLMWF